MYVINRSAVIIRPKQPFVDWANHIADEGHQLSIKDFSIECSVILLPEYDSDEDAGSILKDLYNDIFELELSSWITDESVWPKSRTYEMFLEWFTVEFHSMVFDPYEDDIEKESDES